MALIPRIANLGVQIPKPLGTTIIPGLLSGGQAYFGSGYGAVQATSSSDATGLTDMLTTILEGDNTSYLLSEFLWNIGVSQIVGGYNNDNFIVMLPPTSYSPGDGATDWQVAFYPQLVTDGINPAAPAPTISVLSSAENVAAYDLAAPTQGITNLAGLSGACFIIDGILGEVAIGITDFATITVFNAFQTEVGESTFSGISTRCIRTIYEGPNFWSFYTSDLTGELVLVDFIPQAFGGGFSATKYSISFDEADFNTAVSAGDYELAGINDQGFLITFTNQIGAFGNTRVIYMSFDGTTYDEFVLGGDAQTENNIALYGMSAGIGNNGQFYSMGFDDLTGDPAIISPAFGASGTPIFTRNSQGVKLECSNYCIPFLKQRK